MRLNVRDEKPQFLTKKSTIQNRSSHQQNENSRKPISERKTHCNSNINSINEVKKDKQKLVSKNKIDSPKDNLSKPNRNSSDKISRQPSPIQSKKINTLHNKNSPKEFCFKMPLKPANSITQKFKSVKTTDQNLWETQLDSINQRVLLQNQIFQNEFEKSSTVNCMNSSNEITNDPKLNNFNSEGFCCVSETAFQSKEIEKSMSSEFKDGFIQISNMFLKTCEVNVCLELERKHCVNSLKRNIILMKHKMDGVGVNMITKLVRKVIMKKAFDALQC